MPERVLNSFQIEAYRGLHGLGFADFGRLNLLFGPNNSGKTSVLEGLGTFCRPTDSQHWLKSRQLRDPGGIDESRLSTLRWFFADLQPIAGHAKSEAEEPLYEGHISLRGEGDHPIREVNASYEEFVVEVAPQQLPLW